VFLLDKGVCLGKQGPADDLIAYLQAREVPIRVRTPCATAPRIGADDRIGGAC
jgi:hypothetical protein